VKFPKRIQKVPPYIFAEIDKIIEQKKEKGIQLINVAQGDPDTPTPEEIVEELTIQAHRPENHRYPSYIGMRPLRENIARWMQKRFGVALDPEREIMVLIGAKEGIAHTAWAMVERGEALLTPDPAYPTYFASGYFADATLYRMPLLPENQFLPDLNAIPEKIWKKAKLMLLNYPNNPTSACADLSFFQKVVEWAKEHSVFILHDNAYSEIYYEDPSPSILQVPGAKEVAVELHSFSKTFNMTGWRLGWIAGNAEILQALYVVKTNVDSGVFNPIQYAGIRALDIYSEVAERMRAMYRQRRDKVVAEWQKIGLSPFPCRGTFYLWIPLPTPYKNNSMAFVKEMVERAEVILSPGVGYGKYGEGYVRMALTQPDDVLEEAMASLARALSSSLSGM